MTTYLSRRHPNFHQGHRGYALVLAITMLTVLALITSAALITAQSELSSSTRYSQRSYARQLASAGLDQFYSELSTKPSLIDPILVAEPGPPKHPAVQCSYAGAPTCSTEGGVQYSGWASLVAGIPTPCGANDFTKNCYQLKVVADDQTASKTQGGTDNTPQGAAKVYGVVVQVTTRTNCRNQAATDSSLSATFAPTTNNSANCVWTRFQQRLRTRQQFDYLYFTQFSSLDPSLYGLIGDVAPTGYSDWPSFAAEKCAGLYGLAAGSRPLGADAPSGATPTSSRDNLCIDVSFRGSGMPADLLNGPMYTADDWFAVCGASGASFNGGSLTAGAVDVAGAGDPNSVPTKAWYKKGGGCTAVTTGAPTVTGTASVDRQFIKLPDSTTTMANATRIAGQTYSIYPATLGGTVVIQLACPSGGCSPTNGSGVRIYGSTLNNPSTPNVPVDRGYPPSGVIYIGNYDPAFPPSSPSTVPPVRAVVSGCSPTSMTSTGYCATDGPVSGDLSIFVDGTLRVAGSLQYQNCPGGCTTSTKLNANTTDVLGLTATRQILIAQAPPTSSATNLTLHAVLLSTTGAVSVENWQTEQTGYPSPSPTLNFFGSMAGRYQGVFGGYDPATGNLRAGYAKSFTFDCRLAQNSYCAAGGPRPATNRLVQPPYLVSGGNSRWTRIDTAQIPAFGPTGVPLTGGI